MRLSCSLLIFFSFAAHACPNLAGHFRCEQGVVGKNRAIDVTQEDRAGVTIYNLFGTEIPTDNKVRPIADSDELKEGMVRAWCSGDTILNGRLSGKYFDHGEYAGQISADYTYQIVEKNFVMTVTGSLSAPDGISHPVDSTTVCSRMTP